MNTEIKTIILRFRDLATDNTIDEHVKIINEHNYCWWGWWSKPQEKIPFDTFVSLRKKAQNVLPLYLYNSGTSELYLAKCVDIKYDISGEEIPIAPEEKENVPQYYSQNKCKCWFKFESIEKIDDDKVNNELQKNSYVTVENFFKSKQEAYTEYENKVVYSGLELMYQPRTMWFLRDRCNADKDYEILLYNAKLVNPSNFDDNFTQLSSNEILWLSDLHFSNGEKHSYKKGEFQAILNYSLDGIKDESSFIPTAMILSGDYAYKAEQEEFEAAKDAILAIASKCGIQRNTISMCPGNHDFSFDDNETNIEELKEEHAVNYTKFYKNLFQCNPEKEFCSIKKYLTNNMCPIEVININTLTLQQAQYDDKEGTRHKFIGMGLVGEEQLNKLENELKKTKSKKCIRMLVMHHNLLPVFYNEDPAFDKPYSGLLDAGRVINFIFENNIDIVLHGHVHKQYYKILSNVQNGERQECHIIGLGSGGVVNSELSENNERMYAVISFKSKEQISFNFYRMDKEDKKRLITRFDVMLNEKKETSYEKSSIN